MNKTPQDIDPDQAWFWTERWQQMEREVDADIEAGRVYTFDNIEDAIKFLNSKSIKKDKKKKTDPESHK